jgi:putative zinc finger/helix-turn-helix YgiT family protein
MKKMYCPKCGSFQETYEVTAEQTLPVRGENITVSGTVRRCSVCEEALVSEEHDSAILEKAYALFRERHGLLTPQEIRSIREGYGLSQRAMARLLGCGDVTIHRYESGALQDAAHDRLLRLIREPANLQTLLEGAGDEVPSGLPVPSGSNEKALKFEVYRGANGEFRWRLVASNGRTIASSRESYRLKASALAGIASVKNNAPTAPVEVKSG